MLRGLKFKPGSIDEAISSVALARQSTIHYMTTMAIINAIIHMGNTVATAAAGGQPPAADGLKKCLEELKDTLFPDAKVNRGLEADRVKKILEREASSGELRVKTMDKPKGRKTRRS